jgi:calcineurin-like phosphoesterase family protein
MTLWFTADQHFAHESIMARSNRPFASVREMDRTLIDHWNARVQDDDEVYHLGDLTLAGLAHTQHLIRQLKGRIYLLGDPYHHDGSWLRHLLKENAQLISRSDQPVTILPPLHVLSLPHPWNGGLFVSLVLCHFPLASWHRMSRGSWHLHGHNHGRTQRDFLCYDVGVDNNDYAPVSLPQITEIMRQKAIRLAKVFEDNHAH